MASPVPTVMDPDDPLVTAPELKLSMPLSPFVPASNVQITNDSLLDIVPLPEYNVTEPPIAATARRRCRPHHYCRYHRQVQ